MKTRRRRCIGPSWCSYLFYNVKDDIFYVLFAEFVRFESSEACLGTINTGFFCLFSYLHMTRIHRCLRGTGTLVSSESFSLDLMLLKPGEPASVAFYISANEILKTIWLQPISTGPRFKWATSQEMCRKHVLMKLKYVIPSCYPRM